MAYTGRSKDNAHDPGRAVDQNASVDNDDFLFDALLGPNPPASTGGMVRKWITKTGLADGVATEIFTVTTTNEAGATDGGAYGVIFNGLAIHQGGAAGENAVKIISNHFWCRAMGGDGAGALSSVQAQTQPNASSGAEKVIGVCTMTVAETSEYVTSCLLDVDISGTDPSTTTVVGMVELHYWGFTTAPVIA